MLPEAVSHQPTNSPTHSLALCCPPRTLRKRLRRHIHRGLLTDPLGDRRVGRVGAGTRHYERDGRGEQGERELDAARVEEALLEVDVQDRADHRGAYTERGETSQQPERDRDATEELDE